MPEDDDLRFCGGGGRPVALAEIFEVIDEVDWGLDYSDAVKEVASHRGLSTPTTVADKCTRKIGLKAAGFRELLEDKPRLIAHLGKWFPDFSDEIRERLSQPRCV